MVRQFGILSGVAALTPKIVAPCSVQSTVNNVPPNDQLSIQFHGKLGRLLIRSRFVDVRVAAPAPRARSPAAAAAGTWRVHVRVDDQEMDVDGASGSELTQSQLEHIVGDLPRACQQQTLARLNEFPTAHR